ncbi:hypothetical protein B0H16DRAFT_1433533 [Mycena metata]|uniref:Uncharacterized protein n=1 Tax=Mycena metata TaxID=1033252 RepID=A0AAD7HDE9_9AGAR|nr:hypothetical protein B0H16DRAFT_1433533 [Mycena metata]
MFTSNKSLLACASVFFALAAQTSAHAIPNPALGVKGTPQRSDVQRPSAAKPCGSINIASTLDTSTATPVAADGTVTIQVQNCAGADGSTSVSVQVDQTGTGSKFVAGTVKTNGNPKPTKVESDKVVFSLPAGTKCTGGKAKNLCLVSVKTTSGFGACTVVSQGSAAAAAPPAKATTKAAAKTIKAAAKTTTAAAKTTAKVTTKAAAKTTAKATTTTKATAKASTSTPKSNKSATQKATAAKNKSCNKKKHHHKGKKAAAKKTTAGAKKTTTANKATATAKANTSMKNSTLSPCEFAWVFTVLPIGSDEKVVFSRELEMFTREELEAELERREEVEEDEEIDDDE